jgi:hypothetical protein
MVLQAELARTMRGLVLPNREPAYYGAYWLVDFEQRYVTGSLGALVSSQHEAARRLRVELRVGDRALDNSNFEGPDGLQFSTFEGLVPAPLGDVPEAFARQLWLLSDSTYRNAVELLDQKRAQRSGEVELEVRPADFSTETLTSILGAEAPPLPEAKALEELVVRVSKAFGEYPAVHESTVSVEGLRAARTLVTHQGVISHEPMLSIRVTLGCSTQAEDGMPLSHQYTAFGELDGAVLEAQAHTLAKELTELREAELASDYFGPVLFEGRAAAQVAHELLAMSLSGTPRAAEQEGPLSRRLGKRVLPASFTVYDDPTLKRYRGLPLAGHYLMDDEGVAAQRVSLIESGRLRGMLSSRTPSRDFSVSNGHGRSGLSGWARGMVGNLIVEADGGLDPAALRRRLLRAVAEEGGDFGIIIERLDQRGFATDGMAPPAPERAYKLYPDGRRVLIRGAALGEMSVRDLRGVLAAGRTPVVYDYQVDWSSGLPSPSSVVAPALLFEEAELTKPKRSSQRPKVLPRPSTASSRTDPARDAAE